MDKRECVNFVLNVRVLQKGEMEKCEMREDSVNIVWVIFGEDIVRIDR